MTLQEYNRLKNEVDGLQTQADRAQGALETKLAQLKAEGCKSIKDAEALLVKLAKEEAVAEKDYQKALALFEEQAKGKL